MQSFKATLEVAWLMLDENPAGNRHEITTYPSRSNKPIKALSFVLTVLRANPRPGFIGDLKDATREIKGCQQNIERAFKLVWYLYATTQQFIGRRSSVYTMYNIADSQDDVSKALDSVLHAFHLHPFALSPEVDKELDLLTLTVLNHNHQTATVYEELARRTGKAWVDDRLQMYNTPLRDLFAFQASLFELFWSGTIEQLKRRDVNDGDDPERLEFEKALLELEKALREVIVRSKKRRFAVAFCGMVKAGKSSFLNALMGRAILPSDGESNDLHTTENYSEYHSRSPFYGLAVPASSC